MGLYEELASIDIISPVADKLAAQGYFLDVDGKIRPDGKSKISYNLQTPWISNRTGGDRNCFLWFVIYFNLYNLLPRNCMRCFKVVCRMNTLDELLAVHTMQRKTDRFCKAGIERRILSRSKGLYAAFWYVPLTGRVEEAREFFQLIKEEHRELFGDNVDKVFSLKRGCTELEDRFGPSSCWKMEPGQERYEDLLDATWDLKTPDTPEPMVLRTSIMRRWIEWGIQNGDPTAKKQSSEFNRVWSVSPTDTYEGEKGSPKIKNMAPEPVRGNETIKEMKERHEGSREETQGKQKDVELTLVQ
jgi:hypothetical protein